MITGALRDREMYRPAAPMRKKWKHRAVTLSLALLLIAGGETTGMAENVQAVPDLWTPENAVLFALENNPDTAITRQRIAASESTVNEATSAFYPRVDLNASYQGTDNPMYSFGNILNQGTFNETIDFNDPGTTDNLHMNATVSYNLYRGGSDRAGLLMAEAGRSASVLEMDTVRSQLAFAVVRTFFTIVQADENLVARQSALEAVSASANVARARYQAGDLLKADLLNLEVHLSEASENLIQARHGAELARRAFLNLLGLEQGSVDLAPDCEKEQPVPGDLSVAARPELQKIAAAIEAAEAGVKKARSGYSPSADAFATYQVDQGYERDGSGNSWMAGVRVSMNLFAGGQTEARIAGARARLEELREQQRKLALAINFEVEEAKLALELAEQRRLVTEKMVEQAEESAALNRERFKEGLVLSSELIDVENRLIDAKVRYTQSLAAQRVAVADLRRATGLDQFATGTSAENN